MNTEAMGVAAAGQWDEAQPRASGVTVWRASIVALAALAVAVALTGWVFADAIAAMTRDWEQTEFSHGYVVPFIALFLLWQRKDVLERMPFAGAWTGVAVLAVGLFAFLVGEVGTVYTVMQYGLVLVIAGLLLAYLGWPAFLKVWIVPVILTFMVPLPDFIYFRLSNELQLISSSLGVWFIRLFDISVTQDGNVIDMGTLQLQVAEACNGVRYLFPMMVLAFVVAYFYRGDLWKRILIFLSAIPITVLMNGLRIGGVGVTSEYWGQEMAEGLLHDFEGFAIFGASFAVLMVEVLVLSRLGGDRRSLRVLLGLQFPAGTPRGAMVRRRPVPMPLAAAVVLLAGAALASTWLPQRGELTAARKDFVDFPTVLGGWRGAPVRVEDIFIDSLRVTDHLMLDYAGENGRVVNAWLAYYASQKKGGSVHSPKSCLPGGGFQIESFGTRVIEGVEVSGVPLKVNRSVMRMGDDRQLVWYWFQQRGRVITNEYLVKWYIFWDAVTRQRTDGALVRLMTHVTDGRDVAEGDAALVSVARELAARLPEFVPD